MSICITGYIYTEKRVEPNRIRLNDFPFRSVRVSYVTSPSNNIPFVANDYLEMYILWEKMIMA